MDDFAKCSVKGCQKPVHAGGLCNTHYIAARRRKDREVVAAYRQHQFEKMVKTDDIGIERGIFHKELCALAVNMLRRSNPVDLKTWIEENITLPPGNGYKGSRKMDFEAFPHMKQILKLVDNPDCRRIVLCFAAQSGKTDTIISIAAYLTSYRNRRGLYALPTSKMVDKVRDSRIKPLLISSKVGFKEIKNLSMPVFDNGYFFALALMSSPGTLAEQTGTSWVIMDELDEFTLTQSKDYHPVKLAEKRMQTSPRRLTIIACTPKKTGIGYTYDAYERSKRFVEEIQCTHCDGWFVPDFYRHFRWDSKLNANDIEDFRCAYVECPLCGEQITDDMHSEIVTGRKRWKDLDPELSIAECGFRLPIFLTPRKNFSETVAEYVRSQYDQAAVDDFNNSWLAKPVKSETRSGGEIDYSKLKGDWLCERNEAPENVICMTAGVDVGQNEIWLVVLGWGAEDKKFVLRSEKIERGQDFESLSRAMSYAKAMCNPDLYKSKSGRKLRFYGGLLDSGDGNDTEAVYEFCRLNEGWFPSKGYGRQNKLCEFSEADPRNKYRNKYRGLRLVVFNTHMLQDLLHSSLKTEPDKRHSIQFAADAPDMLFDHIRNQQQIETKVSGRSVMRWGKIGNRPDHLRDATLNAVLMGKIKNLDRMEYAKPKTQPVKPVVTSFKREL